MSLKMKMNDVFDFRVLPHPKRLVPSYLTTGAGISPVLEHNKAGKLQFSNLAFPNMHVMSMGWETGQEDIVLMDEPGQADNININFQLEGNMYTTFPGLHHNLDMRDATHNLVYIPESKDEHCIAKNQRLSLLHITLDKAFFISAIGQNDRWSDNASTIISKGMPFSGFTGTLGITPYMKQLIYSIYHCNEVGPMRNLLIQSRVLELLSLQIGQFTASRHSSLVKKDDAAKLQTLKDYLDQHFLTDLSLTQLARISLLNEFKLKSGFKILFGITVFGYIRNLRMGYAHKLLADNRNTVEEAAAAVGYEHAHHFSAAFKKHFGYSPSTLK